jgi:hypothetical protein
MKGWDMKSVNDAASRGLSVQAQDGKPLDILPTPEKVSVNKFRNEPKTVDGIRFASKLEANRYLQLKMMKAGGIITDFIIQQTYYLEVNGLHICRYIADFVITWADGRVTVEDTKGVETPEFKIKKKLMLAIHGISIELVKLQQSKLHNNGKVKKSRRR